MNPTFYGEILNALHLSAALEKTAAVDTATLDTKVAHDWLLFQTVKEAGMLDGALQAAKSFGQTGVGKGMAIAGGAMVPVGLGGAALVSHASNKAKENTADMRNKALQVALGVGGVGAGLMGLNSYLKPKKQQYASYGRDPRSGRMVMQSAGINKQSSADDTEPLLQKLATVGYLESVFEDQEQYGTTKEARARARECRLLNAEHGVAILRDLLI